MQLTHYSPRFFSRPSSLLASFLGESPFDSLWSTGRQMLPAVNLHEHHEAYEIEVAAPGLVKKDFSIEADDGLLTISCKKSQLEKKEGDNSHELLHEEFSYVEWARHIQLPKAAIDAEKIKASYQDGVLTIQVPKRKEAQRVQASIPIE